MLSDGLSDWTLILSLIFGGCCSNAYYLEQCTVLVPTSGTLLTLATFIFIAAVFLPSQITIPALDRRRLAENKVFATKHQDGKHQNGKTVGKEDEETRLSDYLPRLRQSSVPLQRWAGQVVLYFGTNLLNNVAFAYQVPMTVHIIFRSGGLVINMILGAVVQKKRYNFVQVASVLLVTGGVILSTLAASGNGNGGSGKSASSSDSSSSPFSQYLIGIAMLFVSLIVSGFLGIWQEETFRLYGTAHWREALFYTHFFSLPLFLIRTPQLLQEVRAANKTLPVDLRSLLKTPLDTAPQVTRMHQLLRGIGLETQKGLNWSPSSMPGFYVILVLYSITQLVCISGVNRLTTRVSSVGVTLTLSVRKAVSLAISIYFASPEKKAGQRLGLLWAGAIAVLAGTMGYARGSSKPKPKPEEKVEGEDLPPPVPPKDSAANSTSIEANRTARALRTRSAKN